MLDGFPRTTARTQALGASQMKRRADDNVRTVARRTKTYNAETALLIFCHENKKRTQSR